MSAVEPASVTAWVVRVNPDVLIRNDITYWRAWQTTKLAASLPTAWTNRASMNESQRFRRIDERVDTDDNFNTQA